MAPGESHLQQKKYQYCPKINRPMTQAPCEVAQRECSQQRADSLRVQLKLVKEIMLSLRIQWSGIEKMDTPITGKS